MDYPSEELVYTWENGVPKAYQKGSIIIDPAPYQTVPTDEDVARYEEVLRRDWERRHLPIRHQTPWVAFGPDVAHAIVVDAFNSRYGAIYFLRLPNGRRLRVRPWKVFLTLEKSDAEYMRRKIVSLASGQET